MRLSEVVLGGLIAAGCAGCPGTIEDPSGFQEFQQPSQADSGGDAEDAGLDGASTQGDAAPQEAAVEEAGEAPDAGPGPQNDASMGWDGSLTRDAGDAASAMPDAGSDSGAGCDIQALIAFKCGDPGCHGAPAVSNGLDLTSPDLGQRLLGRMASGSCSNRLLVDPENPGQSALYIKVTPDACGSRMPLGGTLTDVEQACILKWIENLN